MIQLVINTSLLREINERKLINFYGKKIYNDESDINDNNKIQENLKRILDWDINGDNALGIYCGKFESIKRKDWNKLIQFIKENHHEIKTLALSPIKERNLENIKIIKLVDVERKLKLVFMKEENINLDKSVFIKKE